MNQSAVMKAANEKFSPVGHFQALNQLKAARKQASDLAADR
jgi:hypothetical protein